MARPVINLKTSVAAFDLLHRQVDRRRSQYARVTRDAIMNLLMDHSSMIECLRKHGYVEQGKAERVKVKRVKVG